MSAVLPIPMLPTLVNMGELKAYIQSEIKKGIEKALPVAVEKVLSDPENPILIRAIENILAVSDLKILKRLYTHDVMLGLEKPYEEDYVSIPTQIQELKQNVTTEKPIQDSPIIPQTTLELKACAIKDHLLENVKPRKAGVYMNSKEFYYFMQFTISADLRWNQDIRNPRQAKKDIIEKAIKLYPDILTITKSLSKNKVTGIALKPSVNRPDTDT